MIGWGVTIVGIGAAMIAVSSSSVLNARNIEVYGFLLVSILDLVGVLLVVLGFVLIALGFLRKTGKGAATYVYTIFDDYIDPIFSAKSASPNELKLIYYMGTNLFESGVSSIRQMKKWQNANPNIFWVLRGKNDGRNKISGYFCVIPLKSAAAALVRNGDLTGKDFTVDHILNPKSVPVNVYIGALAGTGFRAKGNAVRRLHQFIDGLREKGARHIYTRPVNNNGLRLCRKFGFECVEPDGNPKNKIHYLSLVSN